MVDCHVSRRTPFACMPLPPHPDLHAPRAAAPLDGPAGHSFRALLEAHPHGVLLHNAAGHLVYWNAAATQLLGIAPPGVDSDGAPYVPRLNLCLGDGTPVAPDEHPARVTLTTGTALSATLVVERDRRGDRRWVQTTTALVRGENGAVSGVLTALIDQTDLHAAQEETETMALVARRTDDAVTITDGEGRVTWVNRGFAQLFGFTATEVLGRRPGSLLQGADTNPDTVAEMRNAIAAGRSFTGEILNYRKDGSTLWVELTITPVTDEKLRVSHFVALARDVTSRRNAARRMFQLSAAVAATDDGIALIDSSHAFTFANDAFAEQFGFKAGETLLGKGWATLFAADDAQRFDEAIFRNLWIGDRWRGEVTGVRKGGGHFPVEVSVTLLPGDHLVAVARDVTEQKRRDAEQRRLSAILEATPDLVAISDAAGNLLYMNPAGRRLLGVAPVDRVRLDHFYSDATHAALRDTGIPTAEARGAWSGEGALRLPDGREVPVAQVLVAHRAPRGPVEFHSTIMRDISERKEAEEALRRMSLTDQLTGLNNRRGFFALAQQALAGASRQPGHTILLYFDLNDFKPINDTFGHHVGDDALKEVAEILGETFRESDITGRLGGDEFVALAVNCLDPMATVLTQRLDERLAVHNERSGRLFRLSMGRGLAVFRPDEPQTLQQLLEEADARLYEDKRVRKAARATTRAVQQVESD